MQDVDRNNNAAELVQFTAPLQKPSFHAFTTRKNKAGIYDLAELCRLWADLHGPRPVRTAAETRAALADTSAEAA